MKPILRVYKNSSKYNLKYEVFIDDVNLPSFETDSKSELRIWLDLNGYIITKKHYKRKFYNYYDFMLYDGRGSMIYE